MRLAHLRIENFRIFGSRCTSAQPKEKEPDDESKAQVLELPIRKGLTSLVGQNDSGKSAIMDALRLVLGTTSQDYLRITESDFHCYRGEVAESFTIYCRFEDLGDSEAGRFLEWISLTDNEPILEITLLAQRNQRTNKVGGKVNVIDVSKRSGPNGQGKAIDGDIRSFLQLTYLKPLRDADAEMAAGRGSRLSQLLLNHPEFIDQDAESTLPAPEPEKPQAPPPTLRGIVEIADEWIEQSPAISAARDQLNNDYLKELSVGPDELKGQITISKNPGLRSILEKLELWLSDHDLNSRTPHGLGLNNLLFMAAELLLLSQSAENGLPLLLIEEPEAHLHPQLQLRLMEFLEERAEETGVQAILTTHSPNLASQAKLANISIINRGRCFPLSEEHTALLPGDYRFLERFLEATRANLFFARGVVIVEGDAENILLPVLAELLGHSFSRNGVSIVNVGHRGLFRYSRIFQRDSEPYLEVPVACISDRDIPPDEATYVTSDKKESSFGDPGVLETHISNLKKHDGQFVKTFVSPHWTLEYDLAVSGLAKELHLAISHARYLDETEGIPNEEKVNRAEQEYEEELKKSPTPKELAAFVFEPLHKRAVSKVETAQQLAAILRDPDTTPTELRDKLPSYLIEALEHVSATNSNIAADADKTSTK